MHLQLQYIDFVFDHQNLRKKCKLHTSPLDLLLHWNDIYLLFTENGESCTRNKYIYLTVFCGWVICEKRNRFHANIKIAAVIRVEENSPLCSSLQPHLSSICFSCHFHYIFPSLYNLSKSHAVKDTSSDMCASDAVTHVFWLLSSFGWMLWS